MGSSKPTAEDLLATLAAYGLDIAPRDTVHRLVGVETLLRAVEPVPGTSVDSSLERVLRGEAANRQPCANPARRPRKYTLSRVIKNLRRSQTQYDLQQLALGCSPESSDLSPRHAGTGLPPVKASFSSSSPTQLLRHRSMSAVPNRGSVPLLGPCDTAHAAANSVLTASIVMEPCNPFQHVDSKSPKHSSAAALHPISCLTMQMQQQKQPTANTMMARDTVHLPAANLLRSLAAEDAPGTTAPARYAQSSDTQLQKQLSAMEKQLAARDTEVRLLQDVVSSLVQANMNAAATVAALTGKATAHAGDGWLHHAQAAEPSSGDT